MVPHWTNLTELRLIYHWSSAHQMSTKPTRLMFGVFGWPHESLKEPRQQKKNELGSKPTKRFNVALPGTVPSANLHGLLCNKSLFKTEGWSGARCQVDTYPGGTGVATPTSSPPSILASFIFALPPTFLLLQPQRPQIQLLPGSSGRKQLGSGREESWYVSIQYSRQRKSSLLWFN